MPKTTMNRTKPPLKNRSRLQKINSQLQWAVNFKLQCFSPHTVNEINLSANSYMLIRRLNRTVNDLQLSLLEDAEYDKKKILAERKNKLDA